MGFLRVFFATFLFFLVLTFLMAGREVFLSVTAGGIAFTSVFIVLVFYARQLIRGGPAQVGFTWKAFFKLLTAGVFKFIAPPAIIFVALKLWQEPLAVAAGVAAGLTASALSLALFRYQTTAKH